jgi:hypothetical protein
MTVGTQAIRVKRVVVSENKEPRCPKTREGESRRSNSKERRESRVCKLVV